MERPETLTNAELKAELATYGVHIVTLYPKKRPEYEEQLRTLRISGPAEPVERNPDAARVTCDLEDIVREMKKKKVALRPHQTEALQTFWDWHEKGRGGILGDEMGLGKTCTTIVHLMRLRKLGYGPFLVFSPLSVVDHWMKEIERFSCGLLQPQHLGSQLLQNGAYLASFSKNSVVIVAHWHAEQYIKRTAGKGSLKGSAFGMVVVDEAHRCKNSKGRLHDLCSKMPTRFLLLTGTPIQNTLNELYSLLSIVDRKRFPIHKEEVWAEEHLKKPDEVKEILSEYFLRRTKELVCKDLPPLNQVIFYHGLTEIQTKLYLDVLHVDHESISKLRYNSLIGQQMQLRKISAHPWLLNGVEPEPFEENEELVKVSEKLTVIDRLLKYLLDNGHSVLVFSQFVIFLDIIEDFLNLRGLEFSRIDGSVNLEVRTEQVASFNSSTRGNGPRIFLISTRAGGLGLNLTNADTVLFADSDFNPQVDLQALARSHRIGQTKPVRVIRLVTRYTVEQYLQSKARGKLHLTGKIIGAADEHLSAIASAIEYAEEQAANLQGQQRKKIDLTDDAIEKIVGKTDRKGLWVPIDEDEEKKMEDDQLEVIEHVDDNDKKDIDPNDYKNYLGKNFRVETRDRDELDLKIRCSKYSGTRQNGTVVETELEKDRELRLEKLKELEAKRKLKRKSKNSQEEENNLPKKARSEEEDEDEKDEEKKEEKDGDDGGAAKEEDD
ncbi:hypothetical protein PMAYCL1PPCAC_18897 [Pristionchus mayeri]|uniref:Helicase n=1 Tax=Pristionchus mayeri TaxID=1317129 RepID=A0AAN5I1Q8_9BILA|nr:hypothetical protein PMAYCL1PPCAC_18897 [Pristionchus mayeri]